MPPGCGVAVGFVVVQPARVGEDVRHVRRQPKGREPLPVKEPSADDDSCDMHDKHDENDKRDHITSVHRRTTGYLKHDCLNNYDNIDRKDEWRVEHLHPQASKQAGMDNQLTLA